MLSISRNGRKLSIKDLLDTMDVPESRKDVSEFANIRWLLRNVGVGNADKPQFNELIKQLKNLHKNFIEEN